MADGFESSSGAAAPAWIRWTMPSVADLIFVALLGVLVFTPLSVRLLGDAGIGWHIRTGQQILSTHAIPRMDSFSSSMQGRPWFAWEWLYDVLVGKLDAMFGLNGVVWLTAFVIAAVFACTFRLLIARGTEMCAAVVLVLLAVSASMIHFLARPHVLTWLFTLTWFSILDSSERESSDGQGKSRNQLWALPLLMLLWVNIHGGFLVGFVLWGIFLVAAMWTWLRSRSDRIEEALQKITAGKRAQRLVLVGLLSAAASIVNPYGLSLYSHILSYLSNRFLMDHIDEFRSPDFHGWAQRCFLILLVITLATLAVRGRRLRLSGGLTVLFTVYAGLYASRNIPISSILLVLVVGPLVPSIGFGRSFFHRMRVVEGGQRGHLWPILAVLGTLFIVAHGGRYGSSILIDAHFDPKRMPVEAVTYLRTYQVQGPILSVDYWGGYLIYRLYPSSQVVVDDRHDLYGEQFLKPYLKMIRGERGWDEFLQTHNASCVLLPRDVALASILNENKEWKTIYADDVAIAFVHARVDR